MLKKDTKGYIKGTSIHNSSNYNIPQAVVDKTKELYDLLVELDLPITVTVDQTCG